MDALIIRFSSLGDVILASAVVEAIRLTHPECAIHFLTKRRYEQVFAGDERISSLTGIEGGESPGAIVSRLGRKSYDVVIDLHGSLRSFGVRMLLTSPVIMTVRKHNLARRMMILTRNRYRRHFDVLGNYLDTLGPLGIVERILPRILPAAEAVHDADRLLVHERLHDGGRLIGIAPGSLHAMKRWSGESFAAVADMLADRGDVPVFVGDAGDREVIGWIMTRMRNEARSVAGETNLAGAIGFMSRLAGMITNDSGPMHIAGALGVPFVAVFGPTHPDLGFCPGYPRGIVLTTGEPCSPCSLHGAADCRMPSRRCMDGITPGMVLDALDRQLN